MSPEIIAALIVGTLIVLMVILFVMRRLPRRLKPDYFTSQWRKLQSQLPDKSHWAQAIIEADQLLDEALRKRRIKGKTMGERLVKIQKEFSDNDAVWFGHKLSAKLKNNPELSVRKHDVKRALLGLQQGLKDIGAL